jgi:hypothetical protein
VVVAIRPEAEAAVAAAAHEADVAACRIGAAGGERLQIEVGAVGLGVSLDQLRAAWNSPF